MENFLKNLSFPMSPQCVKCYLLSKLKKKKWRKEGRKKKKKNTLSQTISACTQSALSSSSHGALIYLSKWFPPSDDNVLIKIQITDKISYFIKWEGFPFWTVFYPQKGRHLNFHQALVLETVTGTISAIINKPLQTHSCDMLSSTKSVRISETGRIFSYSQDGNPL